jgi:putative PIN family toxin of toxin-antitoxin system
MRLALDTNVLLAAMLVPGTCRELVRKRCRGHELCASDAMLDESADRIRDKLGEAPTDIPLFVAYRQRVQIVEPPPLGTKACRDPDDDAILAAAVAASADLVVTGDKDLLVLGSYAGIPILTPRQLLDLLDRALGS